MFRVVNRPARSRVKVVITFNNAVAQSSQTGIVCRLIGSMELTDGDDKINAAGIDIIFRK